VAGGDEPDGHGLHVHIGRQAFRTEKTVRRLGGRALPSPQRAMVTDAPLLAAFTYLLSSGHAHLTRIGRRNNSRWAPKMDSPVKAALMHEGSEVSRSGKQYQKLRQMGGVAIPRGAVNLQNAATVEIRVAKSTRNADELRASVRVVYLAAEFVRHLRREGGMDPKQVNWASFAEWVGQTMPEAYDSIAGAPRPAAHPVTAMSPTLMDAFRTPEAAAAKESGVLNLEEQVAGGSPVLQQRLRPGVEVMVATPAFTTPEPPAGERTGAATEAGMTGYVPDVAFGQRGTLTARRTDGLWRVRVDGRTWSIHENYLLPVPAPFPLAV
jgi:hypothetical protein